MVEIHTHTQPAWSNGCCCCSMPGVWRRSITHAHRERKERNRQQTDGRTDGPTDRDHHFTTTPLLLETTNPLETFCLCAVMCECARRRQQVAIASARRVVVVLMLMVFGFLLLLLLLLVGADVAPAEKKWRRRKGGKKKTKNKSTHQRRSPKQPTNQPSTTHTANISPLLSASLLYFDSSL